MSTQDAQQKYSYRFFLEARKSSRDMDGPSKAEVQNYINEVLGIKPKTPDKNRSSS